MKYRTSFFVILLSIAFIFNANSQQSDFPVLKGPYLGQKPPGMTPEVFAPGIVSTSEYTELGCTFSPDGKEFYFTRYTPDRNIWVCRLKDEVWQKPEPAFFNSNYREISPHITADGRMLFFGSTRPHPQRRGDPKDWSMWVSMRHSNEWEEPHYIGTGIYVTSSKTGNIYLSYFVKGDAVIGQTKFVNGGFSEIRTLEGDMNSPYHDNHPCIAPDESYIIFESNRSGSHRGENTFDLYVCYKEKNGTWTKAINIGKVLDTRAGSTLPSISPDGKYLFFNSISDTGKNSDIFWVDAKIIEELKPDKIMLRAKNIFRAIQESNAEEVRRLLKDNHRLMDEIDQDKRTPLHHAAQTQNIEIVRLLVECGAKVNIKDSRGITPFQAAIIEQNKEIVELLIKHGADLELEDANARSPLTRVVFWTNNTEMADLLLKYGADINTVSIYDETPLSVAAWLGKREMVNFLIDKGVRIETGGDRGKKLLIYSATRGLDRLFDELLGKGIDLFMRNDTGGNLLHSAAVGGSVDMAKILVRKRLLLDEPDRYGWTPMHYAVFHKNKDVIRLLIDEGAKLNKKTYSGKTPLHISVEAEDDDISQILISSGADRSPYKFPILEGEYLGQKPPGVIPELFAPDIISTNRMEHSSPVFSPDGKEVYWMSLIDVDGSSRQRWCIKTMRMKGKRWSKPVIASFSEDHRFNEDAPFFSANGNTLCFISNRPLPSNLENRRSKIWFVNRSDDGWSIPIPIGDVINASPTIYWQFSLSANGKLYFGGIRSDTKGQMDIYYSEYLDGKYEEPDNLIDINTQGDEVCPFIAPDESYIIFTSSGQTGGKTSPDLFISFKDKNGSWKKAQNLGEPINSTENELSPIISPDGKYLFYISIRQGNMDVYWVDAKIIEELKPESLK